MSLPTDPRCGPKGSPEGRRLAKYWLGQIKKVDDQQKRFVKRGRSIEKRYRDERSRSEEEGQRRANYLWANTQIIFPALYGKAPLPIAERRFRDKGRIGGAAAKIIERALRNDMETDQFHDSVGSAVLDYLLSGKGACWVRYEPQFEQGLSIPVYGQSDLRDEQGEIEEDKEDNEEEKLEDTGDRLIKESAPVDYIPWEDYYQAPARARTHSEVRAKGKRIYMSRSEMCEWFGDEIGKAIPLQRDDKARREGKSSDEEVEDKGHIYEWWDIDTREVYWVAEGYEHLCGVIDDPLELTQFWPSPRCLCANATNNSIIPIPFYIQYQDQARQIDELTQRISQLVKACKVAGVYNAAAGEIARLLDESVENELLPVDRWQAFAENKGLAGQISLLPLEEIVKALEVLVIAKQKAVEEMDRLTGITDIIRGVTTDGRETLGGQKLKNNNGKTRLRQQQDEVARFCRDLVRIKAEIMSKHFSSRSLIDASGALYEEGLGIADVMSLGMGGPSEPMQAQPQLQSPQSNAPGSNVVPFPAPAGMPQGGTLSPIPAALGSNFGQQSDEQKILQALTKIKAALTLLRDDYQRGFRVDIEVDSTIVGDEQADKESRNEFIGSVTTFLKEAGQLAMANPMIVPLLGKLLQFGVRGYRVGRDLEQTIEEFCDQAEKQAKVQAQQPKKPTPEEIKAQSQAAKDKAELQREAMASQSEQKTAQIEAGAKAAQAQSDVAQSQADTAQRAMELEIEKLRVAVEQMKLMFEAKQAQHEHVRAMTEPQQGAA